MTKMTVEATYDVLDGKFHPANTILAICPTADSMSYEVREFVALGTDMPDGTSPLDLEARISREPLTVDFDTLRRWSDHFLQFLWLIVRPIEDPTLFELSSIDGYIAAIRSEDAAICQAAEQYFVSLGWPTSRME